jgi:hypothetical protein
LLYRLEDERLDNGFSATVHVQPTREPIGGMKT